MGSGLHPLLSFLSAAASFSSSLSNLLLVLPWLHFHLSCISCTCFISSVAGPPFISIICNNVDLTKKDIGNVAFASVSGSVITRLYMWVICDMVGPCYGCTFLIMFIITTVFCMELTHNWLETNVARKKPMKKWMKMRAVIEEMRDMFSNKLVGAATGSDDRGWGNLGGASLNLLRLSSMASNSQVSLLHAVL